MREGAVYTTAGNTDSFRYKRAHNDNDDTADQENPERTQAVNPQQRLVTAFVRGRDMSPHPASAARARNRPDRGKRPLQKGMRSKSGRRTGYVRCARSAILICLQSS